MPKSIEHRSGRYQVVSTPLTDGSLVFSVEFQLSGGGDVVLDCFSKEHAISVANALGHGTIDAWQRTERAAA